MPIQVKPTSRYNVRKLKCLKHLRQSLHWALNGESLASWLKTAIAKSYESQGKPLEKGIRSLKAHSVRGQSVSWADLHAVDILDICMQASWSSPHTFVKHYRLQLPYSVSANHAVAVLRALPTL